MWSCRGHVHLLISEPQRGKLSVVIQMLKQITSRKLRPSEVRHFWQVRYYDFPVWSEKKWAEKLGYIHRNPVTRGLVSRLEDWKWCPATVRKRERIGLQSSTESPTLRQRRAKGWGNRVEGI
jgi:REP element-mobilizing transposase RayT